MDASELAVFFSQEVIKTSADLSFTLLLLNVLMVAEHSGGQVDYI